MSNHVILELERVKHAIQAKNRARLDEIRQEVEKFVHDGVTVLLYDRSRPTRGELRYPVSAYSKAEHIESAFAGWEEEMGQEN